MLFNKLDPIIKRATQHMNKLFGEQLREERKKQGLTVQKVANASGTSRSYITLIENGKRQPGKKILPKIAAALNLKPAIVLHWYLENLTERIKKDLEL